MLMAVELDRAAIVNILCFIPDSRERALLSLISRSWRECVASSWECVSIQTSSLDQLELTVTLWLSKQMPNNKGSLRQLKLRVKDNHKLPSGTKERCTADIHFPHLLCRSEL